MWSIILKIFWGIFGPIIEADIGAALADLYTKYIKTKFLALLKKIG